MDKESSGERPAAAAAVEATTTTTTKNDECPVLYASLPLSLFPFSDESNRAKIPNAKPPSATKRRQKMYTKTGSTAIRTETERNLH